MRTKTQSLCTIVAVAIAFSGLCSLSVAHAKGELRLWADAKGKNKIKARFVKLEDDVVTLEKEDGEEVEIELKKLSAADQKAATEAAKESDDNPFKTKPDDPFKSKSKGSKKTPSAPKEIEKEESENSDEVRTIKFKITTAKQIKLGAPTKSWRVDVVENKPRAETELPESIMLPRKRDFFERLNGLAISGSATAKKSSRQFLLGKAWWSGDDTSRALRSENG